jgi:hypothetical protein
MAGEYWFKIICAYSRLNLTLGKDKLPALSGIAKQILRSRPGDEYLAGLWRKTIITDLRWMAEMRGLNACRPSVWRSPSWSWAATDGNLTYQNYDDTSHSDVRDHARCLDVSVTPSSLDPTGEVSSGYIILEAPAILTLLENNLYPKEGEEHWDHWSLGAAGLNASFSPDCSVDFKDGSLTIGDRLLCLRLGTAYGGKDICLVLKQRDVDGITPLYERVGHIIHGRGDLEKYWFAPNMENMIVKII